jgi:hypothetical protein
MGRAIRDYLYDLVHGDPVALGLTGLFLLLLAIPATIWIIDRMRRGKDDSKKSRKGRDFRADKR